jgi:lipoprotein-anchoring transpeptidase ErfK/SrfK
LCAGAAVAGLSFAPAAGATPATAQERATPALTARVVLPTTAYGAPRWGARRVMSLRGATTWTGSAQRLLVTGRHTDPAGRDWVRVHLPVRPNGTSGWVRANRVRLSATRVRLEVHLGSRRLEIWRGPRLLHRFSAGIGRPGTPTPVGRFAIQDPVPTVPGWRSVYGAWTLTLTAHSNVLKHFMGGDGLVAIHGTGTGRGWRVGQPSSNGCVILAEPELAVAARYARAGTPVVIDRS